MYMGKCTNPQYTNQVFTNFCSCKHITQIKMESIPSTKKPCSHYLPHQGTTVLTSATID